jgi:hypothetical protein
MIRRYALFVSAFALSRLFAADAAPTQQAVKNFSKLPLAFEKSQGQAASAADFLARGAGYNVLLSRGNAHIMLHRGKEASFR